MTPVRRKTRSAYVGSVVIGSEGFVSVQSMTNTETSDVEATVQQIKQLHKAGADLVRVSCPNQEAATAFKAIVEKSPLPIIADIHFHYRMAILSVEAGASCIRINPSNIPNEEKILEIIAACKANNASIRLGINTGSIRNYGGYSGAASVLAIYKKYISIFENNKFFNIKISAKSSNVLTMLESYRLIAGACDYPLHLGVTEAGTFTGGTVKSSIGIGALLSEGIGDTIRVSLAEDPVKEVEIGWKILAALGIRKRGVNIVACPSCSRQGFDVIKITGEIEARLSHIMKPLTVSILGCVVNGPGEAHFSDIGIAGGGKDRHQLYVKGKPVCVITTDKLVGAVVKYADELANGDSSCM